MLILYDSIEDILETRKREEWFYETRLNYLAREVVQCLDIENEEDITLSVNRAIQACSSLHISVEHNFRKIYRFNGEYLIPDWKLSALACYLIIINSNPVNKNIARAQLFFAINN